MMTLALMQQAKAAAPSLAAAGSAVKNQALLAMADRLEQAAHEILAANAQDVAASADLISPVMLDRLTLTQQRIMDMAQGIRQVAQLPDPVGKVQRTVERPNGLTIQRISVPLGVVAIIYESRPNVTSDAAALAVKAGNACILRSGKEAHASAAAIVSAMQQGLEDAGLSRDLVQLVEDTSRRSAQELMEGVGYIDLLIPRGGAGLIRSCVENAKASRPSVCNAAEVCLVHRSIAEKFLPMLHQCLVEDRLAQGNPAVELRLDETAASIIPGTKACSTDFDTEFLDYVLAVAVVEDVEAAIAHIALHSTGHSEAILTQDQAAADRFVTAVDSAAVYVNASTRFTDGGEFGLGCEMGISTQKLHARGPMGLEELTSYKYVIHGTGQIR